MKELNRYNSIIKRVHCARLHGMTYHDFGFGSWASGLQLLPLAVVVSMGSGPLGYSMTPWWLHDSINFRHMRRDPKTAGERGVAILSKIFEEVSSTEHFAVTTLICTRSPSKVLKFEVEIIVHVAVHVCSMAIPSLLSFDDTRTECQSLCPSLSISKPQNGSSFWVRSSFQLS